MAEGRVKEGGGVGKRQPALWSPGQTGGEDWELSGCHVTWEWHRKAVTRKKPAFLTAKIAMFHHQRKPQDAQNLKIPGKARVIRRRITGERNRS